MTIANIDRERQEEQPLAFSIDEFCRLHRISRAALYKYWNAGVGPASLQIGNRRLISREAAERWRREREAATVPLTRLAR